MKLIYVFIDQIAEFLGLFRPLWCLNDKIRKYKDLKRLRGDRKFSMERFNTVRWIQQVFRAETAPTDGFMSELLSQTWTSHYTCGGAVTFCSSHLRGTGVITCCLFVVCLFVGAGSDKLVTWISGLISPTCGLPPELQVALLRSGHTLAPQQVVEKQTAASDGSSRTRTLNLVLLSASRFWVVVERRRSGCL